ncbi:MAG: right-handed parallel beta-helix repeat-containing protein [Planctomycetes bacterium]|nr:right-handed parallel beta-helix repeat-containing protein [Planctomycetota bacterium]
MFRFAATCALVLATVTTMAGADPLGPPPGPIQTTGRTQINQQFIGTLPYTITQPGSYVLTGNLTGDGSSHGIIISSSNVTVDLAGFAIIGANGNPNAAIYATSPGKGQFWRNIAITNGNLEEWGYAGIDLTNATNVRISHIQAYRCGVGLYLAFNNDISDCVFENCFSLGVLAGNVTTMRDCVALYCGGGGFSVGATSVVSRCSAEYNWNTGFNVGEGSVLADCAARSNQQPKGSAPGFVTADRCLATGCVADGNNGTGFSMVNACAVANCVSVGNGNSGFEAYDDFTATNCEASVNGFIGIYCNGGTITNCTANGNLFRGVSTFFNRLLVSNTSANWNLDAGIYVDAPSAIRGCSAKNNASHGIFVDASADGSTVEDCSATNNGQSGITVVSNCVVRRNASSQNRFDGITARDRCTVADNTCVDNGTIAGGGPGAGIRCLGGGARVDGNHVSGNDTGILASVPLRNVIIRNTAFGNSPNYNLNVSNDIGPIGAAATSTSPWANISF